MSPNFHNIASKAKLTFGSPLIGRSYEMDTLNGYRFSFNGKEKDLETESQDYGMRIYDARLSRFLSVDPISGEYPELTPYQFASNIPISGIDLDGLEFYPTILVPDLIRILPRLGPIDIIIPVPPSLPAPVVLPKESGETLTLPKGEEYYPVGEDIIMFPKSNIEWRTSADKYEGGELDKPLKGEEKWTKGYRTPKQKADRNNNKSKDDIPEWARGHRPRIGEKGTKYAKRLLERQKGDKYDPKDTGPGSDYSKLKKHADHDFYKTVIMPKAKINKLYNNYKQYIEAINKYREQKQKQERSQG